MKNHIGKLISAGGLALVFVGAVESSAATDPKIGKSLHDKQCVTCHVDRFKGDGTKVYTRSPRLINDKVALGQRVATCASQINAGWFPDDEEHVAAYLNQRFYKFK